MAETGPKAGAFTKSPLCVQDPEHLEHPALTSQGFGLKMEQQGSSITGTDFTRYATVP